MKGWNKGRINEMIQGYMKNPGTHNYRDIYCSDNSDVAFGLGMGLGLLLAFLAGLFIGIGIQP